MRIVFAGTPDFSVPALDALVTAGHEVVAVYTQPDRPAGRGRQLRESPVKRRAVELKIPVRQPESLKQAAEVDALRALNAELMVVVAYGLILPREILAIPRLGCINVHASLLPRWRGAAPIQRAIMAGDTQTGVSIMQMDEGLDTGPVLLQVTIDISADETGGSLHDRLAQAGGDALIDAINGLAALDNGATGIVPTPQDNDQASYASKLSKAEALIDWSQSAKKLAHMVRAMNPWPVAETSWRGKQLRIWEATVQDNDAVESGNPGCVRQADTNGICVSCGDGVLVLQQVQLAGGKPMRVADFINAHDMTDACLGGSAVTAST